MRKDKKKLGKKIILLGLVISIGATAHGLTVTSSNFQDNGMLSMEQVCANYNGQNKSPSLAWDNIPSNTKSLAITVFDPDARQGTGLWHWVVVNIPVSTKNIKEGTTMADISADATEVDNARGKDFLGACPPVADNPHRYIFTVYALPDKIAVPANSTAEEMVTEIQWKAIDQATITGLYQQTQDPHMEVAH